MVRHQVVLRVPAARAVRGVIPGAIRNRTIGGPPAGPFLAHHLRVLGADQDPVSGSDATQTQLEVGTGPAIGAVARPISRRGANWRHGGLPCVFDGVHDGGGLHRLKQPVQTTLAWCR